jgi:mediator of replication checkpoint protein 1
MPSTIANSRLKALVAKKRAEREAKEEAQRRKAQVARKEDAQKQQRLAKQFKEIYSSEMDDGMTEEAQKALTENSRPTQRRAGKKALEEMNRETQRMARNQQLAHQARVKRKFTTLDFVKSFGLAVDATPGSDDQPRNRGALESSDNEGKIAKGTPPSSPPSLGNGHEKAQAGNMAAANEDEYIIRTGTDAVNEDEELPDLNHLLSDPIRRADKGKSKVTMSSSPKRLVPTERPEKATTKRIRVVPSTRTEDSDDELEIVSSKKPSRFAVFDLLPDRKAHEPASLLNLRALAHMSPPTKKHRNGRHHSMTQAELQMRLAQEMHKQTVAEKQERIEALRARGVVFKTEEEIEEDQLFIENALEKARKEAMELGRKENEAAKKNGEDIDENYALPSDDESEEGDFGEEEEDDDADVEVSGSEDEEGGEVDPAAAGASLFDDAAEEAGEDEDEDEDADTESNDGIMDDAQPDIDEDMASPVLTKSRSKARNRHVILDDDDDHDANSAKPSTPTAIAPTQSQTSPINAFGFAAPNASMGLTQIFQGTMADLATQEENTQATPSGRSLEFLRDVPVATLLPVSPAIPSADLLVESSQSHLVTPAKQPQSTSATPHFTPQFLTPGAVGSQMSPTKLFEIPEPTQDAGFDNFRAAALDMPFSTVETVMMPVSEPAVAPKKGKLHRRAQRIAQFSDDEGAKSDDGSNGKEGEFELTTNAFDALFKASKKPTVVDAFDKKRSEAKNVVEDQAEESEDEYAGLGGASDDDSDNEVDEEVQKMIDEGPVDVKEGELAKFFADKDRADDEKRVDKLYRDITTGALRRKRGAGIDELSDDSDDEAAERRRQKQREFAKMRKALLEDENVGKIGKLEQDPDWCPR